jgi:hypothetical protein
MAYCRFSSDNFGCDLYCYESAEGYVTHVASNRIVGVPPEIDLARASLEAIAERSRFFARCERKRIGLPCDGQRFVDGSLGEMIARVEGLLALGYRVPGGLLVGLRAEMNARGVEQ